MNLLPHFSKGAILLALIGVSISSCKKESSQPNPILESARPVINQSPDDFTLDLNGENNRCSKIVTLDYNVISNCWRNPGLTISLDAPGLVSQTTLDEEGNISFDVEFCTLQEEVIITLTVADECSNVIQDILIVNVEGQSCLQYSCQKFVAGFDQDGSYTQISNNYDVIENLCDHIEASISYSPDDVTDTVATYTCQSIIDNGTDPNLNDFLYFWVNEEMIDSCRILVFISNDFNGNGEPSDGWQDICDLG